MIVGYSSYFYAPIIPDPTGASVKLEISILPTGNDKCLLMSIVNGS